MWWPRSFMHNLAFESESSCPAPSTVPLVISRGSLCTACSSHYWPQIPRLPHSSQGGPSAQPVPHIIDPKSPDCLIHLKGVPLHSLFLTLLTPNPPTASFISRGSLCTACSSHIDPKSPDCLIHLKGVPLHSLFLTLLTPNPPTASFISRGSLCTACSSHYWPQIPRLPHSSQGGPVAQPVPHVIDAHDAACGGTSARDLLHGDGVGQVVQTCPSLCLRNVHAQHPQLTQLLHLVGRQNTKWASSPGGATKHKVSFFTWWGDKTQSELLHLVGRQNTKWASSPGGATKHEVSFFTWWGDKTRSELLHLVGRQNTKWASSPGGATKHKVSFFTWWGDKTQSELLHLVGRQNTKWASSPGGATKHKVSFFTWWGDKTQSELLHLVGRQNTKWASSPGGATKHKVSFFTWWGDKTQSELLHLVGRQNTKWASSPGGATKHKVSFFTWWGDKTQSVFSTNKERKLFVFLAQTTMTVIFGWILQTKHNWTCKVINI